MVQSFERPEPEAIGLNEDWQVVEGLLPPGWMDKARELRAFQRARGITDPRALLQVMFIHLAEGCGLRETAVRAELAGIADVSDVALLKRLRSCGPWFEWLAQGVRAAPELLCGSSDAHSLLGGRALKVVDGSVVSEPGVTGSKWRLHYSIALPQLQCQEVLLGPSDEGETLKRFTVCAGDILVADRGYAHPAGIAHVQRHGGDVIVRMNLVTLPLYDCEGGDRLDVLKCVRQLEVGQADAWPARVFIKAKRATDAPREIVVGRLCAVRKSAAAAEKSRQRVRRESSRNGTELQPQTLEAAEYVLTFTTLPPDLSAQQVMEIYRLRWQIELEFKRLKSLIELGHLKKHDAQAARSWLQGKLLIAFLIARLIAHAERVSPWGYEISWITRHERALPVA